MIRKHRGTAAAILGAAIIVSASAVASAEAAIGRPLLVGLGEPPHLIRCQVQSAEHGAEWVSA